MARGIKEENGAIRVSVRHLVEFICRAGDIDQRTGALPDPEIMQMGSRIHRKIQKSQKGEYRAEVALSGSFPCDDFSIVVEGRADGIFTGADGVTVIDEIKGIMGSVDRLEEPVPVHLAQAKCYAYLYLRNNGGAEADVRMTYCSLETEEIRYFTERYGAKELEDWFEGILEEYRKWARLAHAWRIKRTGSIRQLAFPFPYREGQKELAAAVYRTIARKKEIMIQAPTGTGKTLAVLFPAIKAVGEGEGDVLFYLTARTIARTVAQEAFDLLRAGGLSFRSVTLTAKEKICFMGKPDCDPERCEYAKGHFDRVNGAVYEMIRAGDRFTREEIEEGARTYRVCPFELSLDLTTWADAVICDYNYVFHPRARLHRFFGEGEKGDYIFLVDEAHNLVDRGRDMYSAALVKEDFLRVKKLVKGDGGRLARLLSACSRQMLAFRREADGTLIRKDTGTFPVLLMNLCGAMQDWLEEPRPKETADEVRELYFRVSFFLDILDKVDDCYRIYQTILPDGDFLLKLLCVDPSVSLGACLDRGRAGVLFSATLLPGDYYRQLLLSGRDPYGMYAKSCFDPGHLRVLIARDVTSRYTGRSEAMYRKMARYIALTGQAKQGHYMAFFPSYRMMEDVAILFETMLPDGCGMICQQPGMGEAEREAFLKRFDEDDGGSLIGFCVMGSIFGEGIDLKGKSLIGAVIVGTGLPQVGTEQQILRDYCEERFSDGFRYAYQCPGMNRVLQAAGRVIRTEEDRGVVVLLDERFLQSGARAMFPREWTDLQTVTMDRAGAVLREFWEKNSFPRGEPVI